MRKLIRHGWARTWTLIVPWTAKHNSPFSLMPPLTDNSGAPKASVAPDNNTQIRAMKPR